MFYNLILESNLYMQLTVCFFLGVPRLALAGGLGGCGYWISVFPTDTVKSRIQVSLVIASNKGMKALN